MSLNFFYGDEEYLMEQEILKLKEKLLDKNFSAMNYKYVKNPNFADFISLLRTQPMMFGAQLIVIDIEKYFSEALEDNQVKELEDAMKNISESLHIILTLNFERNSKRKPDSRRKIYKLLQKYAQLREFVSIPSYYTSDLINFINKEAKKQGITIETQASEKLIEQVGNNLRELVKEIEKLTLVAYPKNKVTEQMVKNICITNEDIFVLTDKLFTGKKATALREFRKLCDKEAPIKILSSIQTNLRKTMIIKMNEKKLSPFEISKMVGFTENNVRNRIKALKDADLKTLVKLKRNFAKAELNIKTGKSANNDVQYEIELAFY